MLVPQAASADDEDLKQLSKPRSGINFGASYLANDNARFGQYTGLRNEGAYGIFNVDITKRIEDTGTWFKIIGRNLGLQNRDVRLEHSRQGSWSYFIDYSQTPRYEPFTVNTAVTGVGSAHLDVPTSPTAGNPVQLKTERQAVSFGMNKRFLGNFELQVHFRNEEKDGARIFGRGNRLGPPIPSVVGGYEFLADPINYTTRQFGASIDYNGKQLQLSGGYYGTMFNNKNAALTITGGSSVGGIYAPNLYTPIVLPPDNQSHQAFLSGGYSFTPTTRGTFKAAYTQAIQTNSFFPSSFTAPGIGNNLGGRIDTTLVQAGVTSRPLAKLSVLTNFRFEDRDDKTPVFLYNPLAGELDLNGNRWYGVNHPRSFRTLNGKLEANYALPMNFKLIGGIDYEHWDRSASPTFVTHRNKTDEISFRAELRRSLAETITGTVSYIHSNRFGSHFIPTRTATGDPYFNLIAPFNLSDRNRDKVRLSLNWEPIEPLSVQVMVDESMDNYGHRAGSDLGVQKGSARNYTLDVAYTFSEDWQATAWFSRNETAIDQASNNWNVKDHSRTPWSANIENIGNSFGLDLNGRPIEKLEIGASLSHSGITDRFEQKTNDPTTYTLPNITHQLSNMKLFARYAVRKNFNLQLDYILNRFKTDEWTWNHWAYTDGTKLSQDTNQIVNYVGLSAIYSWW